MNIIINFSHPLSKVATNQLGNPKIENVRVQINLSAPVAPQIETIIEEIKTPLDGTVAGLAIVLPGMSEAAAYVLAALHGRMGTFPTIVPLRRNDERGIFGIAEEGATSLERIRQDGRMKR